MSPALAHKYFPVKISQKELSGMSELAVAALYSKYKSPDDWESLDAWEYAQSIYTAALAGAVSKTEEPQPITPDDEIDFECASRIINGLSTHCFCGNHTDIAEVFHV